ncbi:N5-glutamine S-adenosyl-L-methionine-dependent methyltransferase [Delftia tsuruhatensis]|uniref:N5-glutamine methyltransferase family protein n=1 Tax=Delftia tsuruhatensis TaxID=180282 RepID=UPI001E7B9DB1|nr:class I SAM-dependent methyltransferase [Delftia tsuruhatensis]CAB5656481.1 N5-glutamine S-adenosyl-L-methionine-dependent methyltransferase [Delftia tsuruhatensis]CAC9678956.1 N5-glutamine S-adenosyl-L-methionine-dependent methyltransferase [Delftia tsuruhatensis]
MSSSRNWSLLQWQEQDATHAALWRMDSTMAAPRRIVIADDSLPADRAYRLACEGQAMLWRGDFQNARQLLQALGRRLDKAPGASSAKARHRRADADDGKAAFPHAFHLHRQAQAQRARILSSLLIELDAGWRCALRRAPDWSLACGEAWGDVPQDEAAASVLVPLRELLGALGAHEWRKKGVALAVPGLPPLSIHPHYGVFSPVRGEYLDLVAQAPLPAAVRQAQAPVWDIGVGTGVLSAILLHRGVQQVVATDLSDRALACAQDNLQRLGLARRVDLRHADLFPEGRAALVVCNPPWLPGKASSLLEQAVYDEGSRMLRGFVQGLASHLQPEGEGWLILSDLAEHLKLRSRDELLGWIEAAGLKVLGRQDIRPRHGKAMDAADPLHAARAAELTSLWRLAAA